MIRRRNAPSHGGNPSEKTLLRAREVEHEMRSALADLRAHLDDLEDALRESDDLEEV